MRDVSDDGAAAGLQGSDLTKQSSCVSIAGY